MAKANGKDMGSRDQHHEDSIPTAATPSFGSIGPGTQIDHFKIDHELGRGGAGVVYLAHDTRLGRKVAIKMLPPDVVNNPEVLHRWKREARLLASINHPNISTIHEELEEIEGSSYLVLEYVEGETLRERISRSKLNLEEAVSISLQIIEAISAAHSKGVVHRDLKPANIKITPDGRVKVLDFGIAKILGGRKGAALGTIVTQPGQVIGTPGYMSPEQSLGKETDHRTDIWSFGCVLYEMLTSQRPFPGRETSEVLEAMLQKEPNWENLPKEVESRLREILNKCLTKDQEGRYQSSAELYKDLSEYYATLTVPEQKLSSLFGLFRKPRFAIPAILLFIVLCTMGIWVVRKSSKVRWARTIMLPEAMKLAEDSEYLMAFFTAQEVEKYIPDDPLLIKLWPEISRDYSIETTPPSADISFREYSQMESDWNYLGRTPIAKIRFPKGLYRFKIEKEGFVIRECVAGQKEHSETNLLKVELWEKGSSPEDMVLISLGTIQLLTPLEDETKKTNLYVYWIDKYEVTNEQFKEFIDQGGYEEQKYWKHEFVKDGRKLSWEEAMKEFRDQAGRPGPSTWEGGTYPEGKIKHPVSGVSWYEAAAYAEFAGKNLPSVGHWRRASCRNQTGAIVPWSNMEGRETSPVGSHLGIGLTGLYDMAGNVREWSYNAEDSEDNRRFIQGGSWADSTYMFEIGVDTLSIWDRSPINGFRCAVFETDETEVIASWFNPMKKRVEEDYSNLSSLKIESEDVFNVWVKELYSYEKKSLKAKTISTDDSSPYYRKEEVEFDAAYGGERITAFLLLPKSSKPPYQTVVFFPGKGAFDSKDKYKLSSVIHWDFIIKSGRALIYPLYKGSHGQRLRDTLGSLNNRDARIEYSRDLGRSVDYLESRNDIDSNSLAYYGFSKGACEGPILLAVEKRFKTGILLSGGLSGGGTTLPSGQHANFAPRIKIPVLMVNGKEDLFFPYKTRQVPLYQLLGTPEEHKKHIVYPGTHGLIGSSRAKMQKDVLAWLDKYLGPVD